ncbi:hypothetical protein D3C84_524340 [compost metagenome]
MLAKRALTLSLRPPAKAATAPRCWGSRASSFSRSKRASTGALPPEEMATISGDLSMIDGMMKLERLGSSTTLAKMPAWFALW